MKFVDIYKGTEYETYPDEIVWMETTSTGIWNYLRFVFRSPNEHVSCGLGDTGFFGFWKDDMDKVYPEHSIVSTGELFEGLYWHDIYIIAKSTEPGEFIENLYIGDEVIKIGIPVEPEDESLRIELANRGFECSPRIQSAIYYTEPMEANPDYVILNSKFKELLLNYMSILGNKGSYKSLINSLKWFEYGDLVTIEQVWKNGDKYLSRPISQELSAEMELLGLNKTTSIVLSHKTWVDHQTHNKWMRKEMNLKMYLLGKFFEAYFLPIHLEVVRSAVEDLFVFEDTLYAGVATEQSQFSPCIKPLEVFVKESGEYVSYKYINKILRPSFSIHNNEVSARVFFKFNRGDYDVLINGKKVASNVLDEIYTFETTDTILQTIEFIQGDKHKIFRIQPRDDLQLDIALYEVARNTGRIVKPDIIKAPASTEDAIWLNHRGISNNYMSYYGPDPNYIAYESPFAIKVYNHSGINFNWTHEIDGVKYETLLAPWDTSIMSRNLVDTGWIPQVVSAYNKLIPSRGDIRRSVGLLAQIEFNGVPVNLPQSLGASFSRNDNEFMLTYFFNKKLVTIKKSFRFI